VGLEATLIALDAEMAAAFASAGFADAATFRKCGTNTDTPCTVYVDKGFQQPDFNTQRADPFTSIIAQRSEVGLPRSGDSFKVGSVTYVVDVAETMDDSMVMVTVMPK
jgi:hypothetical protein